MSDSVRLILAGGGTGGHLYPGLAVAWQICAAAPQAEIIFSVTTRPIDRHVLDPHPYQVRQENVTGLPANPLRWPGFLVRTLAGRRRAAELVRQFRPHAVVGLGGFGSYAPVRAAQDAGVPTFILNPDLHVGRANCRLARRATVVFCQFAETIPSVASRGRVEVVGCPIREELFGIERDAAARQLGLDPDRRTLLVTGASSGAQTINHAMSRLAPRLSQVSGWQVLHLTGRELYDETRQAVGDALPHYHLRDYLEEMGLAYAAADLAVARSGAGMVAELTALGLPSVLVPYPYHRDRHQEGHARLLEQGGAAVMVQDRASVVENAGALWTVVPDLMEDCDRRRQMAEAARAMGRPRAAHSVADAVLGALTA